MTPDEFLKYLMEDGCYLDGKLLTGNRWAVIHPLMYTHAILMGRVPRKMTHDDRWCYHTYAAAKAALNAWDGTGEPTGWHRHPSSGRRVDENGKEYIAA